jgi:hypothetical protein
MGLQSGLYKIVAVTALLSLLCNVYFLRLLSESEVEPVVILPLEVTDHRFTRRTTTTASFAAKYNLSESSIWWTNYTYNLSRLYQPRHNFSWCIPETKPTHAWRPTENGVVGLIYIKTYKASSSTSEGISLSIAHNVARRIGSSKHPCIHYNRHVFGDVGALLERSHPSLLWTMIRNPLERDLSMYYFFKVSRNNVTVTDSSIISTLRSYKSFQTNYLLPWNSANAWTGSDIMVGDLKKRDQVLEWMHEHIMDNYDFIGVTERFDESLATMVLLWNLEPTDVIVLSAKQAGGYDDAGHNGRCSKIVRPQPPSTALKEYWSQEHAHDNADFLLWDAVNLSLDRTIQKLGPHRVVEMVQEIRILRRMAEFDCQRKAYFPCSTRGKKQLKLAQQSCYVQDAGCGYECVDQTMAKFKRGEPMASPEDS